MSSSNRSVGDADVNAKDSNGWTLLMRTVENGNLDYVKALIAANADVNAKNKVGDTALILAASTGQCGVLRQFSCDVTNVLK